MLELWPSTAAYEAREVTARIRSSDDGVEATALPLALRTWSPSRGSQAFRLSGRDENSMRVQNNHGGVRKELGRHN